MALQKRKRSQNWMFIEKNLLVDLVANPKHFIIVENKKTDAASMRKKVEEWEVISEEYNSQTINVHRSAEKLKAQWESMKKQAKKVAANAKFMIIKTDGSRELPWKDPLMKRIFDLVSTNSVDALPIDPLQEMQETISDLKSDDFPESPPSTINCQESEESCTLDVEESGMSRRTPRVSIEVLHETGIEAIDLKNELDVVELQNKNKISQIDFQIKKEILKQERIKTRLLLLEYTKKKKEYEQSLKDNN